MSRNRYEGCYDRQGADFIRDCDAGYYACPMMRCSLLGSRFAFSDGGKSCYDRDCADRCDIDSPDVQRIDRDEFECIDRDRFYVDRPDKDDLESFDHDDFCGDDAVFVYNYGEESVAPGCAVMFDQPSVPRHDHHPYNGQNDDIEFLPPCTIRIKKPGLYVAEYYVKGKTRYDEYALAVCADGKELRGSRYSSTERDDAVNGRVLFHISKKHNCPVDITLRNVGPRVIHIDRDGRRRTDNASFEIIALKKEG